MDELRIHARPLPSVAGHAPGAGAWEYAALDVERLRADLELARADWDWSRGFLGHSLPLTVARLSPAGAAHHNNRVQGALEDRLDRCPCFRWIFDALRCDKLAFRVLRMPASSSYTVHADRDVGEGVYRFQIPIEASGDAEVMVSNLEETHAFGARNAGFVLPEGTDGSFLTRRWDGEAPREMRARYRRFVDANGERLRIYRFRPGRLYHFDTRRYHNVWNFAPRERFSLVFDLVANDWVREHFPQACARDAVAPALAG